MKESYFKPTQCEDDIYKYVVILIYGEGGISVSVFEGTTLSSIKKQVMETYNLNKDTMKELLDNCQLQITKLGPNYPQIIFEGEIL